jgi:glycosyltransferase involved in cell wall biosynthesis
MSTVVYAPYTDPSTFYRLLEPARVTGTEVVERLPQVGSADTIVLNRPLDPGIAEQVRLWVADGRRVIVDMDDDFDAVVPGHRIHGRYTTEHLHAACKAATVVTCSTPALVKRYGYGHGAVLRNCIPESYLSVTRRTRVELSAGEPWPLWIGWYGSLGSHPNDPSVAGRGVGMALNPVDGAEFVFAGPPADGPKLTEVFGLDRPVRELGYQSMIGLIQLIAEFDIGIVPLEQTTFNHAKSYLKGLEFAAVGVPVVASPTPEYQRMAAEGGCVTAAHPDRGWVGWLSEWLANPEQRAEQATRGRAWAATQTYERHAGDWRAVWYLGAQASADNRADATTAGQRVTT